MTPELIAELQALERDAARYRYLRRHAQLERCFARLMWYLPRALSRASRDIQQSLDDSIDEGIRRDLNTR